MKHFKRLLLLIAVFGSFIDSVKAQCSPTLREIYDFEVGDQFFYRTANIHHDIRIFYSYSYENFEIISKYINGDTIRYVRKSDKNLLDTLQFVDSTFHPLNHCNRYSDTILNQSCMDLTRETWSQVYITRYSDGQRMKMFGSQELGQVWLENDLGFYNFTLDEFIYTSSSCYSLYKEGLGLFRKGSFVFESEEHYELQKRIRGTDTISIKLSAREPKLSKAITIYPNPAVTQCTVKSPLRIIEIVLLNTTGQIQPIDVLEHHQNTTTFDTNGLAAGIYHIRIQTSSGYAIKKFIKL